MILPWWRNGKVSKRVREIQRTLPAIAHEVILATSIFVLQWLSCENQNWKHRPAIWRPPDFSEKTQAKVVRAYHTIIWTGQDCPTGNSMRKEMKRQTEEMMGRQHQWVYWPWLKHHTVESWEPWGVEEAGCKIYSGAPTVSQTMG